MFDLDYMRVVVKEREKAYQRDAEINRLTNTIKAARPIQEHLLARIGDLLITVGMQLRASANPQIHRL